MKAPPSAPTSQSEYSALQGDYTPVEARAAAPAAVPNGAAPADSNATPPQTTAAPVECARPPSSHLQRRHEDRMVYALHVFVQ